MKTEAEVREALSLIGGYVAGGGCARLAAQGDPAAAGGMLGYVRMLQWVLGDGDAPIGAVSMDELLARLRELETTEPETPPSGYEPGKVLTLTDEEASAARVVAETGHGALTTVAPGVVLLSLGDRRFRFHPDDADGLAGLLAHSAAAARKGGA